ncbi:MAG: Asp-tRNA(Asn)/Glu-tRNA(Gln) amidotransferase subunit GatA, partial [Nitrospirae bacterium]|nr:Asp-tRNA(Asn)/Glu-tRNA(Gln) amidotransferase subunit GatA [Nitrospirota bacterium]
MDLFSLTVNELSGLLAKGETTSRAVTESVLERIKAVDSKVRAYITVTGNAALAQADKADK